jgi:hypothetical protein
MKKSTKTLIKLIILFIFSFISPKFAYSSVDIGDIYFGGALRGRTLGYYISPIVRAAVVLAGVIAFLLIAGGGFGMITAAGNTQQQEKGRNAVTAGVMGLALIVGAVWILEILSVLTGVDLLNTGL